MKKVAYSIIGLMMGLPLIVSAQDKPLILPNPTSIKDIPGLIKAITDFIVQLSAYIFVAMMLVGAFQMLTAAGNETKFSQGKKTITYTIIGMAVVLSADGIAAVIKNFLGAK